MLEDYNCISTFDRIMSRIAVTRLNHWNMESNAELNNINFKNVNYSICVIELKDTQIKKNNSN